MTPKNFEHRRKFFLQEGLTVIELLIMVTILAVISAIVIHNVTSYISKGKDAAIKSTMNSLVVDGSIYFQNTGGYGGFCNDETTEAIFNSIKSTNKRCKSSGSRWVVCARLNIPSSGNIAWCVDSTGKKVEMNNSSCANSLNSCP